MSVCFDKAVIIRPRAPPPRRQHTQWHELIVTAYLSGESRQPMEKCEYKLRNNIGPLSGIPTGVTKPTLPPTEKCVYVCFPHCASEKNVPKTVPGSSEKNVPFMFRWSIAPPSPYTFKVGTYTSDPRAASSTLKHAGGGGRARNVFFARPGSGCYNKMVLSNARTDSPHEI